VKTAMICLGLLVVAGAAEAREAALTGTAINAATLSAKARKPDRALLIKAEVLLDRAHFSPGVIDGTDGDNLKNALTAFQQANGLEPKGKIDQATWAKLTGSGSEPVITDYTLTKGDVEGPFVKKIPAKMEKQASLKRLAYRNSTELLAEKFHMSERLLTALNKGRDLEEAGTTIAVAGLAKADEEDAKGKVTKIVVEKGRHDLRAFDDKGGLVAFYPASIGSREKPAPSGTLKITRIAKGPTYTYNPDYAFKGVKTKKEFTIKAGPNNPVGAVWIALTGEGYGIHGTPEPDKVGKTASHGCVRLTNWDALALAAMVEKDVPVEFVD
jgi:lipoprotein-anchoring transpeptidase ErfK/SrfK